MNIPRIIKESIMFTAPAICGGATLAFLHRSTRGFISPASPISLESLIAQSDVISCLNIISASSIAILVCDFVFFLLNLKNIKNNIEEDDLICYPITYSICVFLILSSLIGIAIVSFFPR